MGALFFVAVLGGGLLLMALLPRIRAGHALFCSVCGMLFFAYYGVAVVQQLAFTAYATVTIGLAGLIVGLACAALGKRSMRARLRSPGLAFFVLACVYGVLATRDFSLTAHDDYSFWARAVRELYTFDRFYIRAGSTMYHTDYIPMLSSLQYCVVRVFGWSDATLTYVPAACLYASAALIADETPRKLPGFLLAVLTLYICRVLGFSPDALRADGAMQLVFAAGLLSLLHRRDSSRTALLPTVCAAAVLVGFKIYSGLLFAAILLAAFAVECLRRRRACGSSAPMLGLFFGGLGLALLMQLSWSIVYNASTLTAAYENARAQAAYLGQPFTDAPPALTLSALLRGNPRNAALQSSFTPENLALFGDLVRQTITTFVGSFRFWLLPAMGAAIVPLFLGAAKEEQAFAVRLFIWLAAMATVYIGGLFGSYLVQSETSGAALTYLATAAAPFAICTAFLCIKGFCEQRKPVVLVGQAAVLLTVLVVLVRVMLPSAAWSIPRARSVDLNDPAAIETAPDLAQSLFSVQLKGKLTAADAGRTALLMDCSQAAARIRSTSFKTHAYAYYALPINLTVYQYAFGDDATSAYIADDVTKGLRQCNGSLLILNLEDERCWNALRTAWKLPADAQPVGVYDVIVDSGTITLRYRSE